MLKQYRAWLLVVVAVVMVLATRTRQHTTAQEPTVLTRTIRWHTMQQTGAPSTSRIFRAKVPGGWLISVHDREARSRKTREGVGHGIGVSAGVTFVPDPEHKWQ